MSLFDLSSEKAENNAAGIFHTSSAAAELINAASLKQFKIILKEIVQDKHYHFWTGGQWSLHELAGYILSLIGPADVYMTTWAITEDPVRFYTELMNQGTVKSLHCVFDFKIREQKGKSFHLAEENFTSVTLTNCHAKMMVFRNDRWGISLPTTANQTRNPRIEYGTVITDPAIADFNIEYIKRIISGEQLFKVRK